MLPVMLPEQVLAVIVPVWCSNYSVDVLARGDT